MIQSVVGVLVLAVSLTSVTLSITGVALAIVRVASGISACLCIFRKTEDEYLERKEQHNLKKYTLACGTLYDFHKLESK